MLEALAVGQFIQMETVGLTAVRGFAREGVRVPSARTRGSQVQTSV
jgi:hypothetical protein